MCLRPTSVCGLWCPCQILCLGIRNAALRDEIYCQVMRLLTNNPKPVSRERLWRFLTACVCSFPPSQPMADSVEVFLRAHAARPCDHGSDGETHGLARSPSHGVHLPARLSVPQLLSSVDGEAVLPKCSATPAELLVLLYVRVRAGPVESVAPLADLTALLGEPSQE